MELQSPQINIIEYIVIIGYLIFLVLVGFLMKRFNKDSTDYFIGGRRSAWWLVGPSISLSMVSAYVFTGVSGAIYSAGFAPLASNAAQWVSGAILVLFLAAWYRQLRKVTAAEVVRQRFGPFTEQCYAYLNVVLQPMYGAFQLLGLSIFVGAIFQIPIAWVAAVLGVVVGLYSVSGGRWAVMATDFLQNLVLQSIIVAVTILSVNAVGGFGNLMESIKDLGGFHFAPVSDTATNGQYTISWMIAAFCIQFINQLNLSWSAAFFSAKDGREAKKAAALMAVIMVLIPIFFTVPSIVARILYSDQVSAYSGILNNSSEAAFIVVCLNLLPHGLLGLVLVAMFSATASSMDSGLNTNAATIVRNVLPPIRRLLKRPQLDSAGEFRSGKYISSILAVVIIGITFYLATYGQSGIFELILNFARNVNFPMTIPFFLVLIIHKAPRSSALCSLASGFIGPWIYYSFLSSEETLALTFSDKTLVIAVCSLTGFLSSFLLPLVLPKVRESATDKAETASFYTNLRRKIDFEAEVGNANDYEQLKMIGGLTLSVGGLVAVLLFIPNSFADRKVIAMIAASIFAVGFLLRWAAQRNKRSTQLAASKSDNAVGPKN